ncbi:MAG TPA: 16S rRNA (guanine(527)-N(7))-methyltransferase RsmG [Candidatus Binatia bacterium]|nr:16S rRNA (guanine(527)-N(7))-methyltransferase RsmG [Candidatus Binatia bacterium]
MERARIAELLQPFTAGAELPDALLGQLQLYLELLLRWNARINLTAVRDPEQIVARHFGESLFAARVLLPDLNVEPLTLADVGAGAGFPGIPMRLLAPHVRLTLIESQNKKATFLREVVRALQLEGVEVFCGRVEQWGSTADIVALRAVEKFQRVLPVAANAVARPGRLCLLIGAPQVPATRRAADEGWRWAEPVAIPGSAGRVVLVAERT